jgi:hypothetical protein
VPADADELFGAVEPGVLTRDQGRDALDLAETLDDFNNGRIGSGHCE